MKAPFTPEQWALIVNKARAIRKAREDYRRLKHEGRSFDARMTRRWALKWEEQIRREG